MGRGEREASAPTTTKKIRAMTTHAKNEMRILRWTGVSVLSINDELDAMVCCVT